MTGNPEELRAAVGEERDMAGGPEPEAIPAPADDEATEPNRAEDKPDKPAPVDESAALAVDESAALAVDESAALAVEPAADEPEADAEAPPAQAAAPPAFAANEAAASARAEAPPPAPRPAPAPPSLPNAAVALPVAPVVARPVQPPTIASRAAAPPVPPPAPAQAPKPEASRRPAPPPLPVETAPPAMPGIPAMPAAGEAPEDDYLMGEEETQLVQEGIVDLSSAEVELREGDRRAGVIVSVAADGAVVDIGGKTEGFLSARDAERPESVTNLQAGQGIEVYVARLGEPGEYVQLALAHDENHEAWERLEAAMRDRAPVMGKVVERVKGGLAVEVEGLTAFMPGSQADLRTTHNLDEFVGTEYEVRVVKLSRRRNNIVVSRRDLLEEEWNAIKQATLAKIVLGETVTGTVKNVTSYGAFVDLGGIDGLIHVTDISYGRVKEPAEVLSPGQEITAKVIKFDAEKERVSLSLREMKPDPWAGVEERYREGQIVRGLVAGLTDYGAFIEIEDGVEGLVHISELTWSKRLKHPSKILKEGQEVEAAVLKVQPEQRRISLSVRQAHSDPWAGVDERFPMGAVVEGRVRNIASYGVFVEIEEGVDGLIHVSDLSWESRTRDPKEFVKKGQTLRAVVISVDHENRRMSLGVKQLEPDVWETFFATHAEGDRLVGRVSRQVKFGAFVEIGRGVEGLCHTSAMPTRSRKGGLRTGASYEFEIVKMEELDRRIGLRCLSDEPAGTGEAPPAG